eukprot:312339-Pleurochrysis_carterae.AAC.3
MCVYNQAAISWASKKETSVSLSSCQAEIVASSEAAKEAIYLRNLFGELGAPQTDLTPLQVDNTAAIDLSWSTTRARNTSIGVISLSERKAQTSRLRYPSCAVSTTWRTFSPSRYHHACSSRCVTLS